jgi:YidC/Oxa1 family membrane protein insertase
MDRKSIIILVASFAVLGACFLLAPVIFPPVPKPQMPNAVASVTNATPAVSLTNAPAPAPPVLVEAPTNLAPSVVRTNLPEELEQIETAEAVYTFTSHGGGLKLVELKKYLENVGAGSRKDAGSKPMVSLNARAQVPTLVLWGSDALTGDGQFKLTRLSPKVIQAEKVLSNGLAITKQFTLTSNYLVAAQVRLVNRSAQALALPQQFWTAGTSSSADWLDDPTMLGAFWYNGVKEETVAPAWFDNRSAMGCVTGNGPPRSQYIAGASNVFWAEVHNQFFTMALLPSTNDVAGQVLVRRFDLPPAPHSDGKTPPPYAYEGSLVYPAGSLQPTQALERDFVLYAGPKEYKTLSRIGHNLDVVMGYTGFFGWFSKGLLLSMNLLYLAIPNYGLVIILITVIIKLLFWPLTQASTRSMKRMQLLQPQMKALQEKYKEDPAKMNKKLMEFMKENKVSPMGGCLPMLLQIPVFIGFYQMIRSAIELRGVHFLWAADLSRPDTVYTIPGLDWIPFFSLPGSGLPINPLPLIMGATMLWQARMTPPSPGMDPAQQKIMKYMPMLFMIFLYKFSAGLTLYWTVQNLLTIAQMKLTKTQNAAPPGGPVTPSAPILPRKKK